MRPLEARAGREPVKSNVMVWRPWQLRQFELFQGVDISTPSRQFLTQEYLLLCVQSSLPSHGCQDIHTIPVLSS